MKKIKVLIAIFICFFLFGCGKSSKYESEYIYDGSIYDDSNGYVDKYGYSYFLDKNDNQAKLYEDTYCRAIDFNHKNPDLDKKHKKDLALFFKVDASSYNLTVTECYQVIDLFAYENPIFYFINEIVTDEKNVFIEIARDYFQSEERNRLNLLIDEKLSSFDEEISGKTNEYDRIECIYNYIYDGMKFAYDDEDDPSILCWAHNIIGFFDKESGTCETYTKMFMLICEKYSIECLPVYTFEHVWNIAKIDGIWFMFDLSNNCFGMDESMYFATTLLEKEYDSLMYTMPKLAGSSISKSMFILKEDGNEIYRSRSIDAICSKFKGGNYEIILDIKDIAKDDEEGKYFFINELGDNYESVTIIANSYTIVEDPIRDLKYYDAYLYITKDLHIFHDVTFQNVTYKTHNSLEGNDLIPKIMIHYGSKITEYRGANSWMPIQSYGEIDIEYIVIEDYFAD